MKMGCGTKPKKVNTLEKFDRFEEGRVDYTFISSSIFKKDPTGKTLLLELTTIPVPEAGTFKKAPEDEVDFIDWV